jgi:hypothetical protein
MAEQVLIGENVKASVEGNTLHLEIDISHRGQRSASGKTVRVASTCGNMGIPGTGVTLGLNAYTK